MLPGVVLLIVGCGAGCILYNVYRASSNNPSDNRYRPNVLASAVVLATALYGIVGGLWLVARSF